jgi:CheY-like chemotaxis protein
MGNESYKLKIFEIVIAQLKDYFRVQHFAIFRKDVGNGEWNISYTSGFSVDSVQKLKVLKENSGFFQRVIETQTPQLVNDITETETALSYLTETEKINSLIAVPIDAAGKLWGILIAFSGEKFGFKEADAKIVTLFGNQIGKLLELFSRSLQDNIDELLIQILGTLELLNFKYRKWEVIPAVEIKEVHERLKNRVLSSAAGMESGYNDQSIGQGIPKNEPVKLPTGEELNIEEVITIQGEKNKSNPKQNKNVLIIDDEPLITELLTTVLERMGCKSRVATCGKEGMETFEKDDFDMVITDLGMPDLSGWDVSKMVKQRKPHVPVIIVTGWGLDPDPQKVEESKVDRLLTKPFQIDQLEKIIKELLEK